MRRACTNVWGLFNGGPRPSYNLCLRRQRSNVSLIYPFIALLAMVLLAGCQIGAQRSLAEPTLAPQHASTFAIDQFDRELNQVVQDLRGLDRKRARLALYAERWPAVQRAVGYRGATHRDAFYGSRAYWHTGSARGITWALDHQGDLDATAFINGKGGVRVTGDANKDIEIASNAIVHILGDLNATLELKGICEVIIAGNLTKNATIICDGQLELFVGGDSAGIFGSTQNSTIVIDGTATGTIQAGAPATTLTVTGDLLADVPPPANKNAVLTLRVDGYVASTKIRRMANAGFTRVTATLGTSDTPPGLYPQNDTSTRSSARWVVLSQQKQPE